MKMYFMLKSLIIKKELMNDSMKVKTLCRNIFLAVLFVCIIYALPQVNSKIFPLSAAAPEAACEPKTCPVLGCSCGTAGDGCGGTLACGTCVSGKVCSGGTCVAQNNDEINLATLYDQAATLTNRDFSYNDYSIEDTVGGGKKLIFYLTSPDYKIRLSFDAEPDEDVITKTIGLGINDGVLGTISHTNNPRSGAYIDVSGQTFKIGNSRIERSFTVLNGKLATSDIFNKISSRHHLIDSDEFGIQFSAPGKPAFIDIERMSLGENYVWAVLSPENAWLGGGDPVIYGDLFVWTKNPAYQPQIFTSNGAQFSGQRIYI
jgi:hypothetical protein